MELVLIAKGDLLDRIFGAGILAGLFAAGGQVPPFTVLPEEAVSVPAGIVIGGSFGASGISDAVKKVFKVLTDW